MPTSVLIPVRLRVDPRALEWRRDEIGDALRAATGRALLRSRDVVLVPRRGASRAVTVAPVFTWAGPALGRVPAQTRREVEALIEDEIARCLTVTNLDATSTTTGDTARDGAALEPFAPGRYDATREVYRVPSYDRKGDDVEVDLVRDPFARPSAKQLRAWSKNAPPPEPVDLDKIWPVLMSADVTDASIAAFRMSRLIEAGDRTAVWMALKALRADGGGPTATLLNALRNFARAHPRNFNALLSELVATTREQFVGSIRRWDNTYKFTIDEKDPATEANRQNLALLGGAEIAALRIPQARELRDRWEKEIPGRKRIAGLFQALALVRGQLERYVAAPPRETFEDLLRAVFVSPPSFQTADAAMVEKIRVTTQILSRFAGLTMLSFDPKDRDSATFLYDMERDLIANQRWIVDVLDRIKAIDRTLYVFERIYGKDYDKQEEVKALRESRDRYIRTVAENPLPTEEYIGKLRATDDRDYAEWFDRAADAKLYTWEPLGEKLADAISKTQYVEPVTHDTYSDRRVRITIDVSEARRDLGKAKSLHGPERLAAVNDVERRMPLIGLRVSFLQLWYAAHATMRDVIDHDRMNSKSARAEVLKKLDDVRGEIEAEWDKPNFWKYTGSVTSLSMWKDQIEWVQRDIEMAEKEAAFIKIAAAVIITVATLGFGAPEGISIIIWTFGEAVVIASVMTGIDYALDKPVSLSGFAVDVATNFVVFGFLKALNVGLLKVALKFPAGQTLSRLAVLFGGNYVGTTLSGALVERFETGRWPENIGSFLALNALLNAIGGALAGPKMITAFRQIDALRGEVLALAEALAAEHKAWLADMDAVAKAGDLDEATFRQFQERGGKLFDSIEQLANALKNVDETILRSMGLSKAVLEEMAARAGDIAAQIKAAPYQPYTRTQELPPPDGIVTSLVRTSGTTYEYNPDAAATHPDQVAARMRAKGYIVQEDGGVIRLLVAGSTEPRYLLTPGNPDIVPPSLGDLVLPREKLSRAGLRVVRGQTAVPPLEAKLVTIASTNPNAAKAILEGIGRRIEVGDTRKLQAIYDFLEKGGSPKALGVVLGASNRYTGISAGEMILRLPTLQAGDYAAIDAIVGLLGTQERTTDVLIGISKLGTSGAERSGVYTAIADIIPHSKSGLSEVLGALSSFNENQNQGALGALLAAKKMIAEFRGAKLDFEVEHEDAGKVIRITDIRVTLPDDDQLGYILAEIKEYVDAGRLKNAKARRQFGKDIVLEMKASPVGDRVMARIRWLVRTPANATAESLQAERDALKASMRKVFDTDPVLKNHPDRPKLIAEFDKYFDQMLIFF